MPGKLLAAFGQGARAGMDETAYGEEDEKDREATKLNYAEIVPLVFPDTEVCQTASVGC